jgi:hypothetical protein
MRRRQSRLGLAPVGIELDRLAYCLDYINIPILSLLISYGLVGLVGQKIEQIFIRKQTRINFRTSKKNVCLALQEW